jgi:Mitochondrial carrier protein
VELLLGAIAGALAQIFTIPVSVIATRQQVGRAEKAVPFAEEKGQVPLTVDAKEGVSDDSFFGVAGEIIDEHGITGLWAGLRPGLVLTANPAITYGVFERIKSIFTLGDPTVKLGPLRSFCVGALSKTLATVVSTYGCSGSSKHVPIVPIGHLSLYHGESSHSSGEQGEEDGENEQPKAFSGCSSYSLSSLQGGRDHWLV